MWAYARPLSRGMLSMSAVKCRLSHEPPDEPAVEQFAYNAMKKCGANAQHEVECRLVLPSGGSPHPYVRSTAYGAHIRERQSSHRLDHPGDSTDVTRNRYRDLLYNKSTADLESNTKLIPVIIYTWTRRIVAYRKRSRQNIHSTSNRTRKQGEAGNRLLINRIERT